MQILVVIYLRFFNDGDRQSLFFFIVSAVAFKNAKQYEQAKDACLREAVAHENNRAYLFQPLQIS